MTIHLPIAASDLTFTPASRATPSLPPVEATRQASQFLPAWANTAQGRAVITAIKIERPAVRIRDAMGFEVRQYAGRNAAQLRAMFDRTFATMIDWVDAARVQTLPGRPMKPADQARYEQRREAVVAWAKDFGPDELIRRLLGDHS